MVEGPSSSQAVVGVLDGVGVGCELGAGVGLPVMAWQPVQVKLHVAANDGSTQRPRVNPNRQITVDSSSASVSCAVSQDVGDVDGDVDGATVGSVVIGDAEVVGPSVGLAVGDAVGASDGDGVGAGDGYVVGAGVLGATLGKRVGDSVGDHV